MNKTTNVTIRAPHGGEGPAFIVSTPWLIAATILLLTGNALALEAREVKGAADRAGNWLIEQFDLKEKVFGKGPEAKDVATVAMCVTALCNHPRDYKEASGPFISEPVKYILSQIKEDGTVIGGKLNAYAWVVTALTATGNEKHAPAIGKCLLAHRKEDPGDKGLQPQNWKNEVDFAKMLTAGHLLNAYMGLMEEQGIEVTIDVAIYKKPGEFSRIMAANLVKVQQKDGSFANKVWLTALMLENLNDSYNYANSPKH